MVGLAITRELELEVDLGPTPRTGVYGSRETKHWPRPATQRYAESDDCLCFGAQDKQNCLLTATGST